MELLAGGIDVFYVDESVREPIFVTTAVRVPFLRKQNKVWTFVWPQFLNLSYTWRRNLSKKHQIRFRAELHGYQLLRSQGLYHRTWRNLSPDGAYEAYHDALSSINFLPPASVLSSFATDESTLMGNRGVKACLVALFQRLRSQCISDNVNGLLFFDEGHSEYIKNFRQAQKWLPTGSSRGGWFGGSATKNLPLSMFPKDANFKKSDFSYFLQIADLVAYAARLKLEQESGLLTKKRERRKHHLVYDAVPRDQINMRATSKRNDGLAPT